MTTRAPKNPKSPVALNLELEQIDIPEYLEVNGSKIYKKHLILLRRLYAMEAGVEQHERYFNVSDIIEEKNAERRRVLITLYGGIRKFLREGGGKVELAATKTGHYEHAQILSMEVGNQKHWFIRLINQTPVTGWERLTPKEREDLGLDEQGRKIYVEDFRPPMKGETMLDIVGSLGSFPIGFYNPLTES